MCMLVCILSVFIQIKYVETKSVYVDSPCPGTKGDWTINLLMPSGLFYLNSLDQSISSLRGVWSVLIITMFYWNAVINANGVEPGSTLFANVPFIER